MKRNLALILALLMLSSSAVACSNNGGNSDETKGGTAETTGGATAESTEETEDPNARLDSGLDKADFDGYTFHIFVHDQVTNDFDAEDITGEPINDAMYQRTTTVQDNANVTIEPVIVAADMRGGQKPLGNSVTAGTNDYDLVCMSAYSSCNALIAGYFQNLNAIQNLDLSKPWWDQYSVEEFSFKDAVFQVTGDISIGDNKQTFCIYFNKTLANNYQLDNMYEMVDNGTWTIDNFRTLAEKIDGNLDYDNDGNHVNDPDDIYGIYIWDDIMMGIVNAAGIRCCTIGDDGNLALTLNSERFVDAFNKFSAYAYDKDLTCEYQRNGYDKDYGEIAFSESRALFYMKNLGSAVKFREMEDDFGILPLPKFDESQERYYNSAASWGLPLYSVPKSSFSAEELARTGYITQALAYESLYTLTPAYYEQTLQNKVSRDVESSRMLDLLFATRCYDFGWYFEIGTYNEAIMNLLRSYSTDVSSMYKKFEKVADKTLKKYNEKIQEQIDLAQ